MKYYLIACVAYLTFQLLSAETVLKMSASFSFPSVGNQLPSLQNKGTVLVFNKKGSFGRTVLLAWSIPENNVKGTIRVYALSGALIKTFQINNRQGLITWNFQNSYVSNGIYLTILSCGPFSKSIKMLL